MMKRLILLMMIGTLIAACDQSTKRMTDMPAQEMDAPENIQRISGIDLEGMNTDIRPQDDFYEYANGKWIAATEIPAEEIGWGSYMTLRKTSLEQSKAIIEGLSASTGLEGEEKKISDFYKAWMDEALVNEKGGKPLMKNLKRIEALTSHDDVMTYFGAENPNGLDGPFNFYVGQDDKDSTRYIVFFVQSGLGLPNRDYYFDESERGQFLVQEYQGYISRILSLAGHDDAQTAAAAIVDLETRLAEHHWTKVENRDADKVYNPFTDAELTSLLSNLNLDSYLQGIGLARQPTVIVMQPSYLEQVNSLFREVPVETWKHYLQARTVSSFANFLSEDFVQARFDFYSKTLAGSEEQTPRWRRAVSSINSSIGEMLGKIYVERHFKPESKERMVEMVANLNRAYEDSIKNLGWMSDETKEKALIKLSKFTPKIGYPDKWKDYSSLELFANDLVGNIKRARTYSHNRNVDKLGKPIDRTEWFMAPQQVNAYYNPGLNEIVFPAAYLQSPNFIPEADDAYNYGAIGVTIGHEIGHGFDDQGSKYDGDGNLRNWWTDEDRANFEIRTKGLVDQFNKFEALPGLFVNGELTLGENIGDLGGTAIALKAYRMSLEGEDAPNIDGLTGEERFFIGNAQASRLKWRDQFMELLVKSDPHSPDRFRINGVMSNMSDFYSIYDVKESDELYLPEADRVSIWH
jgi:predicted metalloendopeptidase